MQPEGGTEQPFTAAGVNYWEQVQVWLTRPVELAPRDVLLAAFASVAGLGALLHFSGQIGLLSPYFSIALALLLFTHAPGYVLVSLLQMRRPSRYDFLTLLLLSTSLGLTWNFLTNVVVFLFTPNIGQVVSAYVAVVAAAYAGLIALRFARRQHADAYTLPVKPLTMLIVSLGVLVIYVAVLHRDPAYVYVEELLVLRKVVELDSIRFDSIGYELGDRTTYIFIPIYLCKAMITRFLDVDVLIGHFVLWPFTALMSVACIAKLVHLISDRRETGLIILGFSVFVALFVTIPPSIWKVDFLPPSDRYAIAAGLLLPLALFHFFMHVQEERFSAAMLVGLVYLIVENTFVHAKETIYLLAIFATYGLLLLVQSPIDRHRLMRTLSAVGLVLLMIGIYSGLNLFTNQELADHLDMGRRYFANELIGGWQRDGLFHFFPANDVNLPYRKAVQYAVSVGDAKWMRLVVILLPIYALNVRNITGLLLPVTVSLMILFGASAGVKNAIGLIVGEPDFFFFGATLCVLCLIMGIHMIWLVGQAMPALRAGGIPAWLEDSFPIFYAAGSAGRLIPGFKSLASVLVALSVTALIVRSRHYYVGGRSTFAGDYRLDLLLAGLTLVIAFVRIRARILNADDT